MHDFEHLAAACFLVSTVLIAYIASHLRRIADAAEWEIEYKRDPERAKRRAP